MHILFRAARRSTQELQTPIWFSIINDVEAIGARHGLKLPRAGLGMQVHSLSPRKLSASLFVLVVIIISNIMPQTFRFALVTGEDILDGGHGSTIGGDFGRHFDFPPSPKFGVSTGLANQRTYSVAICLGHRRHSSIAGFVVEPEKLCRNKKIKVSGKSLHLRGGMMIELGKNKKNQDVPGRLEHLRRPPQSSKVYEPLVLGKPTARAPAKIILKFHHHKFRFRAQFNSAVGRMRRTTIKHQETASRTYGENSRGRLMHTSPQFGSPN
jgi:hypothetical protein